MKKLGENVQTSLWLKKELKHIVDNEEINLSKFVNDCLEQYFSVSTIEDVDAKIAKKREEINILERKRADLVASGICEKKTEAIGSKLFEEMQKLYVIRHKTIGYNPDLDFEWVSSPKNLQRCKILGKEPLVMVKELREWYDSANQSGSI